MKPNQFNLNSNKAVYFKHDLIYRAKNFSLCLLIVINFITFHTHAENLTSRIQSNAFEHKDSIWKDFRKQYPYFFQMIGIKEFDDESYLFIISEPPPHANLLELRKLFDSFSPLIETKKHFVGYDGWVKDVVICAFNLSTNDLEQLKTKLSTYLYFTDYKGYFHDLPIKSNSKNFLPYNLNYQVSSAELEKWFLEDNELLISSYGANYSLNQCFDRLNSEDVYFSKDPGFVIWLLDRYEDIGKIKDKARKFTLDSDLILGAISRGKYVAIIGREREVPVTVLPPLRVETILLLASTVEIELSQSYERNNFFAGKLSGGKDWAPILLSDELWHAEYGNLLNVTDQILKSWSENGKIEYDNFLYEKPVEWTFNESAIKDLKVNELTYNWNTSGAGYIAAVDLNTDIYALNRTGSLPVSYIPEGQSDKINPINPVYLAEENAYDYFSFLNNPDLVRVVQYASLYQIFKNFRIICSVNYTKNPINSKLLEEYAYGLLLKISDFDETQKEFINHKNSFSEKKIYEIYSQEADFIEIVNKIRETENTKMYNYLKPQLSIVYKEKIINNEPVTRIDWKNLRQALNIFLRQNLIVLSSSQKDDLLNEYLEVYSYSHQISGTISQLEEENDNEIIEWCNFMKPLLMQYKSTILSTNENLLLVISKYLANSNSLINSTYTANDIERIQEAILSFTNNEKSFVQKYNEIFNLYPIKRVKDEYVHNNIDNSSIWIKCPTIVMSWSKADSSRWTGGHNLDSRVTHIEFDEKIPAGKCFVEKGYMGNIDVRISPEDGDKITPDFLRKIERTNLEGTIQLDGKGVNARPRNNVLSSEKRQIRGFNEEKHLHIKRETNFITIGDKKTQNYSEIVDLMIKNYETGKIVFENFSINEAKAIIINSKDIVQTAILKKDASFPEALLNLDYTRAEYSEVDNLVTVKIPYKTKEISGIRLFFNKTSYKKVNNLINEGLFKNPTNPIIEFKKDLKKLGIDEEDVKIQILKQIQSGRIVEKLQKNRNNDRFNFSANAA